MRILVTGGAGFIGTNLVQMILDRTEHEVINLDKLSYAANRDQLQVFQENPRFGFHQVDLARFPGLDDLVAAIAPDWILHLAAESHVDRSIDSASEFIQSNVVGTQRLLDAALAYYRQLEGKQADRFRLIHVSTDEVFGSLRPGDQPFDENSGYAPNSPYSASKAASDHLVRAWHQTHGLPAITLHCGNNYGPFQYPEKLIPVVIQSCLRETLIPVYGSGLQVRDWIHVDDHCQAILAVAEQGRVGEKYVVGSRNEISNIELVRTICDRLDRLHPRSSNRSHHDLIEFVSDRPGHDFRYALDPSKMETEIGWSPQVDFEQGLATTLTWYLSHDLANLIHPV